MACRGLAFARGPPDVEPREVSHGERPHRKTEINQRVVDLVRRRTVQHYMISRRAVGRENPVTDESVTYTGPNRNLVQCFAKGEPRRHHVRRGLVSDNNFKKLHDMGRRKEMQTNHAFGARRAGGDFVDVQIRSVRGKDRIRFANCIKLAKHILFHRHILEYGLDHQINRRKAVIVDRHL